MPTLRKSWCVSKVDDLFAKTPSSRLLKPVYKARDYLRSRLAYYRGHLYPIVSIDELPFAHAFAKGAFNKASAKELEALGPGGLDKVIEEIGSQVDRVLAYPADFKRLEAQAAEISMRLDAVETAIEGGQYVGKTGFEIDWPRLVLQSNGDYKVESFRHYFANLDQLEIRFRSLNTEAKAKIEEARSRIIEQAILFKKLETYRHELLRVKSEEQIAATTPIAQKFLDRLSVIYKDDSKAQINHPDLSPPQWAWQRLRWIQLKTELASLFTKDFPHIKDNDRFKRMVELVGQLSDAEKRVLGLSRVSEVEQWYKRTRWGNLGGATLAIAGGGGGLGAGAIQFYRFLYHDSIQRTECVEKDSHDEFLECATAHLKDLFKGEFFLTKTDLSTVINDVGQIADPRIRAEIAMLKSMRIQFVYGRESSAGASQIARGELEASIPGTEPYRERMIHAKTAAEFERLLLSSHPQEGYLQFKYPILYSKPRINELCRAAVQSLANDEQRFLFIRRLKDLPGMSVMADDLDEILNLRKGYITQEAEDKKIIEGLSDQLKGLLAPRP